jgi:hypothetical protein
VRTKRSAIAFAFGARTGVRTISIPSLREHGVEVARELAVAMMDEESEAGQIARLAPKQTGAPDG